MILYVLKLNAGIYIYANYLIRCLDATSIINVFMYGNILAGSVTDILLYGAIVRPKTKLVTIRQK